MKTLDLSRSNPLICQLPQLVESSGSSTGYFSVIFLNFSFDFFADNNENQQSDNGNELLGRISFGFLGKTSIKSNHYPNK